MKGSYDEFQMRQVELCQLNAMYSHTESSLTRDREVTCEMQWSRCSMEMINVSG